MIFHSYVKLPESKYFYRIPWLSLDNDWFTPSTQHIFFEKPKNLKQLTDIRSAKQHNPNHPSQLRHVELKTFQGITSKSSKEWILCTSSAKNSVLNKRSIKNVLKSATELPKRSSKSVLNIARKNPKRSIKNVWKMITPPHLLVECGAQVNPASHWPVSWAYF